MAQVNLNTKELKDFMHHMINNNREIQSKGLVPVAINIVGDHGLGKTTVIQQLAMEEGLDFVKLNLGQLDEISD